MRKQLGKKANRKEVAKLRRKLSIRKKVIGTAQRPRLCVAKTNKNLSVQVIDDSKSVTLFSVQSFGKSAVSGSGATKEGAKALGEKLASDLKSKDLSEAVFDRSGHQYHGVIASLVDTVRENGIRI